MTHEYDPPATLTRAETYDDRFGICPICGRCDDVRNIGRSHWLTCKEHRLKWLIGENLFSHWRSESDEDWRRNAADLAPYTEVKPAFHNTHMLPDEVTAALDRVISHFWGDEARDFAGAAPQARSNHIFRSLHALDRWMRGMPQRLQG